MASLLLVQARVGSGSGIGGTKSKAPRGRAEFQSVALLGQRFKKVVRGWRGEHRLAAGWLNTQTKLGSWILLAPPDWMAIMRVASSANQTTTCR